MKALLAMYSLREAMAKDLEGTLAISKELGYDGVELAWYAGHPVSEVRAAVKKLGIDVWSCHTDVNEMLADEDGIFSDIASLGARYVIICHMPPEQRPGGALYEKTRADVKRLSKKAKEEYGLTMLYHNHDFDLAVLPDGRRSLDVSYQTFEGIGGELDTCWVQLRQADSADYLTRYSGRIPLIHMKDFRRTAGEPGYEFCPLGWGEIDFEKIICAAEENKTQALILEMDEAGCGKTAEECVRIGTKKLFELMGRN